MMTMKAPSAEVNTGNRAEEKGWQLMPTELLSRIFLEFELKEKHATAWISSTFPAKDRARDVNCVCQNLLPFMSKINIFCKSCDGSYKMQTTGAINLEGTPTQMYALKMEEKRH